MHPENDESRPGPGQAGHPGPGQEPGGQAALSGPDSRPRRRSLALGAAAVLALTGTVLGVVAAGSPAGPATAAGAAGAARSGAGGSRMAGQHAISNAVDAAIGQPAGGRPNGQNSASQSSASQGSAGQAATGTAGSASGSGVAAGGTGASAAGPTGTAAGGPGTAAGGALRTSCRSVAHIGDSTSADLISAAFLPNASQRLAARYRDVGVRHVRIDASGGRSIVEALPGQRNGYTVAAGWRAHGYRGCWVFALGTNDAANVAAGSAAGLTARINQMMAVAHGQPVLWVNTRTELSAGPWSNVNEHAWDAALTRALARYPNMRIFNWAAVARPGWFLPDGIHYNTAGCAARARAIANALARAFPAGGHSKGKVVL